MKLFGLFEKLTRLIFSADDGNAITVDPPTTPGSAKTITLPNATDTLVGKATTDTLTNKTIDANGTGNSITNLETADLASGVLNTSTTLSGASDTQLPSALATKTYIDDSVAANDDASEITYTPLDVTDWTGSVDPGETNDALDQLAQRQTDHEIDTSTHGVGEIVGTTEAQTLSSKTLTSPIINTSISGTAFLDEDTLVSNAADKVASQQSIKAYTDNSTSTHAALTAAHGATGAVVGTTNTQTLTNKTLETLTGTTFVDSTTTGNNATAASDNSVIRYFTNSSLIGISRIAGGTDGRTLSIVNKTGSPIVIYDDDGGVGPILVGATNQDVVLNDGNSMILTYDGVVSKWKVLTGNHVGSLLPVTVTNLDSPVTAEDGRFYLAATNTGAITINLPDAQRQSQTIGVQNIHGDNDVTVAPFGSNSINGFAASETIADVADWKIYNPLSNTDWRSYEGGSGGGGLTIEVKTTNFTAEKGKHYLCTSGVTAVTLPTMSAVEKIAFSPIRTADWSASSIIFTPGGADTIEGDATYEANVGNVDQITFAADFAQTNWEVITPITPGVGGGGLTPETITTGTTVAETGKYYLVDTSGGAVTLTLPDLSTGEESIGFQLIEATNTLTVNPHASDTLDGATTLVLRNERDWRILNAYSASEWESYRGSSGNGATITEWESFTPSSSYNGSGTEQAMFRRSGDSMYIQYNIDKPGVPDGSVDLTLTIPNSLTIDLTNLIVSSSGGNLGMGHLFDNSSRKTIGVDADSSTTLRFPETEALSSVNSNEVSQLGVMIGPIPINEWKSTGTTVTLNDLTASTNWVGESVVSVSNNNGGTTDSDTRFRCTRDANNVYHLEMEIIITSASSAAIHIVTLGLGGAVFDNLNALSQAGASTGIAYTGDTAATVSQETTATTSIRIRGSGTLDSKPSWFDANAVNQTSIDAQVDEATSTQVGLVKKNKYEVKEATGGDITTTGIVAALQIANLEIGKTYSIQLQGVANVPAAGEFRVSLQDAAAVNIIYLAWYKNSGSSTVNHKYTSGEFFFTPTVANDQTLDIDLDTLIGATTLEGGTANNDRLQLIVKETNNLVSGTF